MWSIVLTLLLLQAPAPGTPASPEVLTELDQLRIENADLWDRLTKAYTAADTCRAELTPHRTRENEAAVRALKAKTKAAIEAAHPCCTYDVETRAFTPRPAPQP